MADILFSERMKNKFSKWRDGLLQEQSREEQIIGTSKDSKQLFEVIFFKMHPAIRLSGFTSRQLKLIQLVIRKHFQDLSYVCVNSEDSGSQHMVVYTDSRDELNLLLKEVKDGNRKAEEKKIQNAVGFRHVIDLLSAEKKLIVGHNCFLDIAHVYNKFIGPLPGTPEEFVTSINKYFPHIVDTKILFNNNHVLQEKMKRSRKSLASAFSLFCPQIAVGSNSSDLDSPLHVKVNVEVNDLSRSLTHTMKWILCPTPGLHLIGSGAYVLSPKKEESKDNDIHRMSCLHATSRSRVQAVETATDIIIRSSSWNPGAKHEAGYDAFMTGCIFAQICSDLGVDYKHHESSPQQLALNEKLQKYVNHLYLSWIHGDIIDLNTGDKVAESTPSNNLKRQYPKILFENIVIIWGFPSQLKANDLRVCISKVFGPASVVSVYHLDATAVFVQFSKTELVYDFLLLKDTLERSDGTILVLHPLAKILEGGNTCAADYDTYKEICGSPISEALFAEQAKAVGIKWKTKLVESQVTLQAEDHESPGAEGSVNSVMKLVKTKPNIIEQLRNAPSHRKVSSFETEDSCCAVEMNA
ncbi:poly(A)-specific ribonuclease PARN isoform X2 [Arachis duranensis]|uniref:Poly(A)-specific ribonuclease PARN isoform X2 n=1 Tax=Arachis duranensis TaxID=130453 RepID=A0A9C6WUA8_ARADU|nr:poly(A)-specific ribonuclease PARN isoform X2 [Arachis duranensis]